MLSAFHALLFAVSCSAVRQLAARKAAPAKEAKVHRDVQTQPFEHPALATMKIEIDRLNAEVQSLKVCSNFQWRPFSDR